MPASSRKREKEPGQVVYLDVRTSVVLRVLLVGTLFLAAVQLVQALAPFFLTLAIAAFLAVAADPVVRVMEQRGLGRGPAVAVLMLAIVTALALMAAIFTPPLVDQGDRLVEEAPEYIENLRASETLDRLNKRFDVLDRLESAAAKLPGEASRRIGNLVGALVTGIATTLTILFLMVLLLMGGDRLVHGTAQLFPQIAERRWWMLVQRAYRSISAYVAGTLLIAFMAGTTMTVSLLVLGLPYPLPLGLWMMLLGVIPLIGATLGAVPAVIVAFAAGGLVKGLILLGIVVVYQQLENILIQPRIQGKVVSLPPLIIFLSVLIGAQLMGVLGALFAVPMAGIVQILYRQYVGRGSHVELPPIAPDTAPGPPDIDRDGDPGS